MRTLRLICVALVVTLCFPLLPLFAQQPFLTTHQWTTLRNESNGAVPYENLRYLTSFIAYRQPRNSTRQQTSFSSAPASMA